MASEKTDNQTIIIQVDGPATIQKIARQLQNKLRVERTPLQHGDQILIQVDNVRIRPIPPPPPRSKMTK